MFALGLFIGFITGIVFLAVASCIFFLNFYVSIPDDRC